MENNKTDLDLEELLKIIDTDLLQKVLDTFSKTTGMATIAVSYSSENLTKPSNFTDFCNKYTRGTSLGKKRCEECDLKGGETSQKTGKPSVYYCHAGLMDFGAPIVINDKLIGSVLGGQILPHKPENIDKFREIAREIGVNENEYINALNKVKILPEDQIRAAAELLFIIVNELANSWTKQYKIAKHSKKIKSIIENVTNNLQIIIKETKENLTLFSNNQNDLTSEIENINTLLKDTKNVLQSVEDIADQTRMLGLNASIEAARAGSFGSGFSVVASEIRKLSNISKETVKTIKGFTDNIQSSVSKTTTLSTDSKKILSSETDEIDNIYSGIKNMDDALNDLYNTINE